jgi:cold shock CspA family protein
MTPSKKTCATKSKTTPSFTPAEAVATTEVACETVAPIEANSSTDLVTSGRVKWFNNKAGYGFITVNDCETNEERDMFVHHSEIKVDQIQYKYLVQGEYVEFVIGAINRENKIDAHATNVRGINGGKLMCETRNEVRSFRSTQEQTVRPARPARQESARQESAKPAARQESARPARQESVRRPQLTEADQTEWMVVPRRRVETAPSRPPRSQPRQRQPEIEMS